MLSTLGFIMLIAAARWKQPDKDNLTVVAAKMVAAYALIAILACS
jgi:hypothetical protein